MIAAFLLLLLRKIRVANTSCSDRKMSQRVEEQGGRDGRVADANVSCIDQTRSKPCDKRFCRFFFLQEPKAHTKEQAGGTATSEMRGLDLPPPAKNHPVVLCLEDKESEEKQEVSDESLSKEPSSEVTTPGVRFTQVCVIHLT